MEQQLQAEVRELAYRNYRLSEELNASNQVVSTIVKALEVTVPQGESLTLEALFGRIEQLKANQRESE